MPWPWRRRPAEPEPGELIARFVDGPMAGRSTSVRPVEGRPPKTLLIPDAQGGAWRYGLEEWEQSGHRADYAVLHRVDS